MPSVADPEALPAVTPKVMDNGAVPTDVLQPVNQFVIAAAANDLATAITLANSIRTGLIAVGIAKVS